LIKIKLLERLKENDPSKVPKIQQSKNITRMELAPNLRGLH
jgi:hypothetical protein